MTSVPTREAPTRTQEIPAPGRYRHFKGGEYELLEVARHSETEELLAIYCSLDDPATTWVRPLEMFGGVVESPDGVLPRFELTNPVNRRPHRPLTSLLLRVLELADRRAASVMSIAVRSPLHRSGDPLRRTREPL
jgi:hypothetical protein